MPTQPVGRKISHAEVFRVPHPESVVVPEQQDVVTQRIQRQRLEPRRVDRSRPAARRDDKFHHPDQRKFLPGHPRFLCQRAGQLDVFH